MATWSDPNIGEDDAEVRCPHLVRLATDCSLYAIEAWCEDTCRPGIWFYYFQGGEDRFYLRFSDTAVAVEARIRWS